jgi:hypothetical protein
MSPPETLNTPMSSGTDPPILTSIYTTSPYAEAEKLRRESRPRNQNQTHLEDLAIIESIFQSDGQEHDEDFAMSVDHTVQLIKLYVSPESTPLCLASLFGILTVTVFETR